RNAAFSVGSGGMVLVFLSMYGVMFLITQYLQLVLNYSPLGASLRLLPISPVMVIVATRTPRLSARFGANRTVATGLGIIAISFVLLRGLGMNSGYLYVLICVVLLTSGIALAMSPMTASIMSAVPARRAGAGSAMNDATRELGAAFGVAILGSIAASKYSHSFQHAVNILPESARASARSSLAGAVQAAQGLNAADGRTVTLAAQHSFIDGIHLAATVAAVLTAAAAALVLRYLPREANHQSEPTMVGSMEIAAEMGLAGTPPAYASEA
ncbi:MAG: transporter, partial [Acidimicrobiia bacterium]|nr:transporter [Acidimicrobiia bacterium]